MRKTMRGFSLIEMVLVGALLAVLGISVYSAFSQGVRLWRYVMEARPSIDLDVFTERLTSDLRNAFIDSNIPFYGEGRSIRFFTMVPASSDEGVRKMFGKSLHPVFMIYEYDGEKKQIVQIQQEYTGLLSKRKKNPPLRKVVLDHVQDMAFSFYRGRNRRGDQVWKKAWKDERERCMPQGVRIAVQLDDVMSMRRADQVINLLSGFCKEG